MKDIAIYRLQRVDKALERLDVAVSRLEGAIQTKGSVPAPDPIADPVPDLGDQALQAELSALRRDYDTLHTAASVVADRLDSTITQLSATASKSTG